MFSSAVSAGDNILYSQYNLLRKDMYQIGTLVMWGGSVYTPPTGWLICDGSSLSTSEYANLFSVIGYTFGGSGSVFNLPNMKTYFPIGAQSGIYDLGSSGGSNTVTLSAANIPSHAHTISSTGTAHTHQVPLYRTTPGISRVLQRLDLQTAGVTARTETNPAHAHGGATSSTGQSSPSALTITPAYLYTHFIIFSGLTSDVAQHDQLLASQFNNLRSEAGLPGIIALFTSTSMPSAFLLCDGSAVSRTTYAALYAAIGTQFGIGDGSTTFNLPDFTSRFIRGANIGSDVGQTNGSTNSKTLSIDNLPLHSHVISSDPGHYHDISANTYTATGGSSSGVYQPSITQASSGMNYTAAGGAHDHGGVTGAVGSSTSFTCMPKYLTLAYVIRY